MAVFDDCDGNNYEVLTPPNYFTFVMTERLREV